MRGSPSETSGQGQSEWGDFQPILGFFDLDKNSKSGYNSGDFRVSSKGPEILETSWGP